MTYIKLMGCTIRAPMTAGKIISPSAEAIENSEAIRWVTAIRASVHINPVANVDAIPQPIVADPTYKTDKLV